jgi:L-rhamnose mutarotase
MAERTAFRMNLDPGQAAEYEKRHAEIWPDLSRALKDAGVSDYSIWLDPETNSLFATLVRSENHAMDTLREKEIVRLWWAYMADIMQTHPDNEPVQVELRRVFQLE